MLTYFDRQLETIGRAVHSLDEKKFSELVDAVSETIASGHKIIATGLGKNVPICEKFVGSMVSLGMDAFFLHTDSALHGDMGIVKDGDLVIILTKSGETEESVLLAKLLAKRDISMWLLTFEEQSTLSDMISNKIVLSLEHEGDPWNIMPNNSTTLNLIILQGLVMYAAAKRNISLDEFRKNHPGGNIGKILNKDACDE